MRLTRKAHLGHHCSRAKVTAARKRNHTAQVVCRGRLSTALSMLFTGGCRALTGTCLSTRLLGGMIRLNPSNRLEGAAMVVERVLWVGCAALALSACDYKYVHSRHSTASETRT